MPRTPNGAEKRNGKLVDSAASIPKRSNHTRESRPVNQGTAYPSPAYFFDADELPLSRADKRKRRQRERRERQEEQETVMHLIESMRYGGEPRIRNESRGHSGISNEASAVGATKNTRFAARGLRVHWARFKQRLGTASGPSESLLDGTGESSSSSRSLRRVNPHNQQPGDETDDAAEVDEIVVDNVLGTVTGGSQASEHGGEPTSGGGRPDLPGVKSQSNSLGTMEIQNLGFWGSNSVLSFFRWGLLALTKRFFVPRFEECKEHEFQRDTWWSSKTLGILCSLFFVVHWILILGLAVRPFALSDKIFYYGVGCLIAVPLPFLVIFDFPFKKQLAYQVYLALCVWPWSLYTTVFMHTCDFYQRRGPGHCGLRDFTGVLFFSCCLPAIAMFGLRQTRISNAIGFSVYFIITCVLILPDHSGFTRNIIDALLFHVFLLYIHYKRELVERRNFLLRDQLKAQYRTTQKAQINERRASDSKRRLTSYVFHEVRVPLNTAHLAVQNLEAMDEIPQSKEIEWRALRGSLSMMSKVLNDVLDFDRLDSGRFTTVKTPYNLHQTIRSILIPLGLAAKARGLTLIDDLDKNIERVARRATLAANGLDAVSIAAEMRKSDEDGLVLGDEMRLRQVINNLASNACKFTPTGGQIRIVTRLVFPSFPSAITGEGTGPITEETIIARTTSKVPSAAGGVEKDRREGDSEKHVATRTDQTVPDSRPTSHHAKETDHSSLKSLKRSFSLWRWQSFRKRANTVSNDETIHARDMLDAAEKGTMPSVPTPTPLSTAQLVRHNSANLNSLNRIIVRIEVHDTGVGIRPRDLVDNKLFSPYVQTEIGKYQGGKGTGLGLALVRRIVKLSGGRLGVRSKLGEGSTFWVELPLGVGKIDVKNRPELLHDDSDYSEGQRQLALGLEDLKFARAIGEGDTPSTMVTDQEGALAKGRDTERCAMTLNSKRALKNVMDQRGLFELVPPPLLRVSQGTPEQTPAPTSKPDFPPPTPYTAMPPTPPQSGTDVDHIHSAGGEPPRDKVNDRENKEALGRPSTPGLPSPPLMPSQSASGLLETITASSSGQSSTLITSIKGVRVLVVDDDMVTRTLMSRMLTRLGCVVNTAENGKVALEKILGGVIPPNVIRGEPGTGMGMSTGMPPQEIEPIPDEEQVYLFDIVFLDNQMPIMSGLDTVGALRALGRKDLVVGVTGNALLSDQQEYLDVGADRVLTKPVSESSLKAMLSIAVQRKEKRISALRDVAASS